MDFGSAILVIREQMWGWPLILTMLGTGLLITLVTGLVQVRYFTTAWRLLLTPKRGELGQQKEAEITPMQAFLGALGTSIGNGNIAGIATGIALGGPGAAFWLLVAGFFGMAIRFSEVFLGTYFSGELYRGARGGPMVYLSKLPGKTFLPYVFALLFFLYGLTSGNAMQAHAIGDGICRTWQINHWFVAVGITLFLLYAVLGGAHRILRISDRLTPFKVFAFLVSAIIVLAYHYNMILPALALIFRSAFSYSAFAGGTIGFTLQQAMRNGLARALNANEAGLGVAAQFFGASGSKKPVEDSIMSMCGVFISSFIVCFLVALIVIASGVWHNGEQSTALAVSAYETVFGAYGGWVVTFVAASFGLGVMVAFLFIGKTAWLFLTNNRWGNVFYVIFCAVAFAGTLAKVDLIWNTNDLVNGSLILLNLYAIVSFVPLLYAALKKYKAGIN
jgi:AGCS family alanine or glycine:cation symporter